MKGRRFNAKKINKEFGESLVRFQLMSYRGWDVESIDYVGVDLIAIDIENGNRYAIQVKLRHFIGECETNSDFTFDIEMKLRAFVEMMSIGTTRMIPVVAYVNINRDQSINTVLINLDDLSQMRREKEKNGISYSTYKEGYICNTNTLLEELMADSRVTCYRYIPASNFVGNCLDGQDKDGVHNCDVEYSKYKEKKEKENIEKIRSRKERYLKKGYLLDDEKDVCEIGKNTLIEHDKLQKGTYGEWYYMLKSLVSGYHPFLVQSEGIDILRLLKTGDNKTTNISAVSVKTFSKKEEDTYTFEISNKNKINEFCDKWDIADVDRIVVLQFLIYRDKIEDGKIIFNDQGMPIKEYYMMYTFEMKLGYLVETCSKNYIENKYNIDKWEEQYLMSVVDKKTGYEVGYKIDWRGDKLLKIQNDDNIDFSVVVFDQPYLYENIGRTKNNLDNNLLYICDEKNISIGELSAKVGISYDVINNIMHNEYVPSLELALNISNVLGVPVNEIFSLE